MSESLSTDFEQMFGIERAYNFQIEVAEHLLHKRNNVILQAPTGSGKTGTALFPFLYAWQHKLAFPRKCLYAVPLRVLTEQFKDVADTVIRSWPDARKPRICLQTGEQQEDTRFEGDLIFTTIDQVISSALSVPYSLSNQLANLNAGAVFSSYLVCDELHLFPINRQNAEGALATLIELLSTFGDTFPFLLMTATLSEQMLKVLGRELNAKRVVVSEKELADIDSQQKIRRYHVVDIALNARSILEQHHTRSIAICNQVQRASDLYDELYQEIEADPEHRGRTKVKLLHSRFIQSHRKEKEESIRHQFRNPKKDVTGIQQEPSLIIVATQTIEVGLDITCERLHTELAPANAIIQRAGRCARYKDEEGDVSVYQFAETQKQPHLPYDQALCNATWEELNKQEYKGQIIQFHDEQRIVSAVHNATDEQLFKKIKQGGYTRWRAMSAAMLRGDKEGRASLIRAVDSRIILVHDYPEQINRPYSWKGFSIFHGTLRKWIKELHEERGIDPWMIRFPIEIEISPENDDPLKDVKSSLTYCWEPITSKNPENMVDVSPIFVVHPSLVSYDKEHGLRFIPPDPPLNPAILEQEPRDKKAQGFETRYNLESYVEHIEKMLKVYRDKSTLAEQIQLAAQRLASIPDYGITSEQFERAVLLAMALHDVGKLQVEWQIWSHAYQEYIGERQPDEKMVVHTHYKPEEFEKHKEANEALKKKSRPPHSSEGAWASWPIILHALDKNEMLSRAVFTAIARHHAAFASTIDGYTLSPHSTEAIDGALQQIDVPGELASLTTMGHPSFKETGALDHRLIRNNDSREWLLYTLIVRVLRLCDGRSQEEGL